MRERAFVIGDIHLGGGEAEPGLEDFHADDLFSYWVRSITSPETTLILNGDFVDFAQIPPYEVSDDSRLLWTEKSSLRKLESAEKAHPACFGALRDFLAGGGLLRVNIGNHDLDFAWPRVQALLKSHLAPKDTGRLTFSLRSFVYHGVLVEHGHQFTPENCPRDPEHFIHALGDERYLERVWGTDFMLAFYNSVEREFPYADNVKPLLAVLYYGLRNRWINGVHFWRLLVFLKRRGIPWEGVGSALLDADELSTQRALASVDSAEWKSLMRDLLQSDDDFGAELRAGLDELSGAERQALLSGGSVEIALRESGDNGAVLGIIREGREERAAQAHLNFPAISHVVFGHTHQLVDGALNGALFNPGTWIPHLRLDEPAIRGVIEESGLTKDLLSDAKLYVADRRAVLIEPDKTNRSFVRLERIC